MPGLFISYRREDSAGYAGRLFDRLSQHFGDRRVFMDVTGIEPGVDFTVAIEQAIGACDPVLVVIGRHWLDAADEKGRRLDDPKDFVRLEIAAAMRRNVRVVPVLVGGATMPKASQLPEDLQLFAQRNAVTLTDDHWDSNVNDLLPKLDRRAPDESGSLLGHRRGDFWRRGDRRHWLAAGLAVLALAAGFEGWRRAAASVVVPNVVGQAAEQATAMLRGARLEPGATTQRRVPAGAADGVVLEQVPAAGARAKAGNTVALVVAAAPPAASLQFMPPTLDFAAHRLNTSSVESVLIVNRGSQPATLREVLADGRGSAFTVAAGACAGNTLVAGEQCTVDVYFVPRSAGRHEARLSVVDTEGRSHAGTVVTGEGSAAVEAGVVEVPRLAKLSYDQAYFVLADAGLAAGTVKLLASSTAPSGTVLQQLTAAGSKVPPRTAIDFIVAVPPANVPQRAVRGDDRTAPGAGVALSEAGTPLAPLIVHFVYDAAGKRLCYGVAGARSARIEPAVGEVRPAARGCVALKAAPAPRYTLSASGGGQTVHRVLSVP